MPILWALDWNHQGKRRVGRPFTPLCRAHIWQLLLWPDKDVCSLLFDYSEPVYLPLLNTIKSFIFHIVFYSHFRPLPVWQHLLHKNHHQKQPLLQASRRKRNRKKEALMKNKRLKKNQRSTNFFSISAAILINKL